MLARGCAKFVKRYCTSRYSNVNGDVLKLIIVYGVLVLRLISAKLHIIPDIWGLNFGITLFLFLFQLPRPCHSQTKLRKWGLGGT